MASSATNNGYPVLASSLEPYLPNTHGGHGTDDQAHSIDGIEESDSGRTLHHNSRGGLSDENKLGVFQSSRAGDFQSPEGKAANNLGPAEGTAAAAAPQGQKPMKKFAYSCATVIIATIVIWLCLPVYWGSLWKANKYTDKLTVLIVNCDSGTVGNTVTSTLLNLTNLNYFTTPASEFATNEDVANDVIEEGVWAAIVINEGVSDRLVSARQNGLSTWCGSGTIEVYYAQRRQETAINSYMLPHI
ncbi:hypothetical protein L198_05220 [Cryptococcus wingfieldii CBS 7118]|uniref:DUF3533 domain-containing protein n=1 Tax=Cryptococcus wingfieldii CBS 7118 TaxID=1295528 RepID=A0A1E3J326_9TREE|nr:hypothetical protein L198_05220 [Cryptococcus wingfieldii CBS 7118]ODN94361.1 hypothetical protein L198_05220 [Cryptococcus wingfieldii CBS 7118]